MRGPETTLGGPERFFPETTVGFLSLLRRHTDDGRRAALDVLCTRYWKPVYAYVRSGWSKSNEDAKDLTQAFFLWIQENGALARFEEERGGLRPYLKVLLRRFVKDKDVAVRRLKRGGGVQILPLAGEDAAMEDLICDPRAEDPEAAFERVWRTELVEQAVERLRARCRAEGREVAFSVLEGYDLAAEAERPTYRVLGERLGLAEADVKKHLFAMRDALLREIRTELAQLTAGDADQQRELEFLFGG
ncbi:MAG: sigma-70 family RNA polymerase sigma factor [Planctomycetaceae bacterium]|nr:sigma-70 family RNA polymerase sigma factor [Planctomycetaceae bacterium]